MNRCIDSTAQLRINCLRSAHKFRYLKKFLSTNFCIIEVSKARDGVKQGWHYGTVRSEFAYYVPRTFNRTVPAYRTSVQFLKRTIPTYRTRTITKKAYRTSVPYFLAKIEAYHTVLTYRTVVPSLLLTTRNFN